jgi:hypothetical protein
MKQKIGVITRDKTLSEQLKVFNDIAGFVSSGNLFELFQAQGHQKLDRLFIFDEAVVAKELKGAYGFIRSKPHWQKTPIVFFSHHKKLTTDFLLVDPDVRFFTLSDGIIPAIQKGFQYSPASMIQSMTATEMVSASVEGYLKTSFKSETTWTCRPATEEDMQKAMNFQYDQEIAANLIRMKLNIRVLEENFNAWEELFPENSPNEMEGCLLMVFQQLLAKVIDSLLINVGNSGIIFTPGNSDLPPSERSAVLKLQKANNFVFENQSRQIILEMTRYI